MPRAPKTPVKRSSSADSSGEDKKPAAKRGKKATPASPAKKGVTWTQDLDLALFNQLYMRRTDVSWDDVALKLGVDKQACKNRYQRHLKKNLEMADFNADTNKKAPTNQEHAHEEDQEENQEEDKGGEGDEEVVPEMKSEEA